MNEWPRALVTVVLCFVGMNSCIQSSNEKQINYQKVQMTQLPKDFKLPKMIFDQLDSKIRDENKNLMPVYNFTSLKVRLSARRSEVIKMPVEISYPTGGGELNLNQYILTDGVFSWSIVEENFSHLPTLEHIYYMSDALIKKIDQDSFGMGCGKFVDLIQSKNNFFNHQKNTFSTVGQRHLLALAGHYVFIFRNKNQVWLTSLYITDSRYTDLFCSSILKQGSS